MSRPLAEQTLVVVTGKGGVGKTTIAAAVARRWSAMGARTLLTTQAPEALEQMFGVRPQYAPQTIAERLWVSSLDAQHALKEYVERHAIVPALYETFLDSRALKQFTEAAPGFEELMCLGKLYDLVTSTNYDRVVFDAPSTGHAALMLRVPRVTAKAIRGGPLHRNALKLELMLENDTQTAVITVALPEEMAVRETIDLRAALRREANIHPGPVVLNRFRPQLFTAEEVDALAALDATGIALERMVGTAKARFELSATQAAHAAELERRTLTPFVVPEVIRDRHDVRALLDAVGAALAPMLGERP